jgi:hypothetical protein
VCDTLLNQPCRPDAFTASNPPGQLKFGNVRAAAVLPASCPDRRRFSFHLHHPRGERIIRARVLINGRVTRVVRGHRLTRLTLRRLPLGTFTVTIRTVTNRGTRAVSTRTYSGCTKSRPRHHFTRPRRGLRSGKG